MSSPQHNSNKNTMKYAGMAASWLVTLGVAVWLGIMADDWLKWNFPLFTILLPTLAVLFLLWRIIKEFSKPKK